MNYYSRGKLLISGEYLVLKGAKALMVPLLKGQTLSVGKAGKPGELKWRSCENDQQWFEATFNTTLFDIVNSSDEDVAVRLKTLLLKARNLNPSFIPKKQSFEVVTNVEFDRQWGFGSSSSLIANIAQWANVDPFVLHGLVSKGSGYDVIAARQEEAAYFTLTDNGYGVETVHFSPPFRDQIFFVFLGQKQDSARVVRQFLKQQKHLFVEIRTISELSMHIAKSKNIKDFEFYLREHDNLMSSILRQPRLKDERFQDLSGEVKPLGAWGGDFAMMTWSESKDELQDYLKRKKIDTVFSFNELVKTK